MANKQVIKSAKAAGIKLIELGKHIKKIREEKRWSLRGIEKKSRELYPDKPERQISNGYLNLLENGEIGSIHPYKLRTISLILQCDYFKLLELADYLDTSDQEELNTFSIVQKFNNLSEPYQKVVITLIDQLSEIEKNEK